MSVISKKKSRLKRAIKTRNLIRKLGKPYRLCVFRSLNHIYGQITNADGSIAYISSSSLDPGLRKTLAKLPGLKIAEIVAADLAVKAKAKGISKISFDRSGYKYHGRIKAFADSLRSNGLDF